MKRLVTSGAAIIILASAARVVASTTNNGPPPAISVPEPISLALLSAGAAALTLGARWFRRK
jgi:hypothetical protein